MHQIKNVLEFYFILFFSVARNIEILFAFQLRFGNQSIQNYINYMQSKMPGIIEGISSCVSVEYAKGSEIIVRFENGHQLKVSVANGGGTICEIDLVKGDHVKLTTAVGNIHDIERIQPFDEPCRFDGQITYTDHAQFALIDNKIVIYDKYAIQSFEMGEKVTGLFIQGDYHRKNDYYVKRAIEIESKKSICPSLHGMRFKNTGPSLEIKYNIPYELYQTINSKNVGAIVKILNEYLPKQELTMENIGDIFHTLVNIKRFCDTDYNLNLIKKIVFFIDFSFSFIWKKSS